MGRSDINNNDAHSTAMADKIVPLVDDLFVYLSALFSDRADTEVYFKRMADTIRRNYIPISEIKTDEAVKLRDKDPNAFTPNNLRVVLSKFLRDFIASTEHLNSTELKKVQDAIWEFRRIYKMTSSVVGDETIWPELDSYLVENLKTLSTQDVSNINFEILRSELVKLNAKLSETIDNMIPCIAGATDAYNSIFAAKISSLEVYLTGSLNLKKHDKDITLTYSEDDINEAKTKIFNQLLDCLLFIKDLQSKIQPSVLDELLVAVHNIIIFLEKKHPELNILKVYDNEVIKQIDAPKFKKELIKAQTERAQRIITQALQKLDKLAQIKSDKLSYNEVKKMVSLLKENLLNGNVDISQTQPFLIALLDKLNKINKSFNQKFDLTALNQLVEPFADAKLDDVLANDMVSGLANTSANVPKQKNKKESEVKLSQNEAATRIQSFWRSAKVNRELNRDPVGTYRGMLFATNTTDSLPERMYGRTVAHISDEKTPFYNPRPSPFGTNYYHRTDGIDVREHFPEYGLSADPQDNYFPFSQLKSFPIETLFNAYLGGGAEEFEVIKSDNNDVAFFKYPSLDEYQTNMMQSLLASLGFKSSPWALANAYKQEPSVTPDNVTINPALQKLMSTMPTNLESLMQSKDYNQLSQLAKNSSSPCQMLATVLLRMISGLKECEIQSSENIQRIALFLRLALTFYQKNYVRFSIMTNAVIHEISLILNENLKAGKPTVKLADMRAEALDNFFHYLDLPEQTPQDNYSFDVFPAASGTNAFAIALSLATDGMKFDQSTIKTIGPIYYELKTIFQSQYDGNDVYLVALGPMVTDNTHYLNDNINEIIRNEIWMGFPPHPPDKPITLVVDLTISLYKNIHLDEDIQALVKSGMLSIVFFESHQKFGLLHSDQAQYGRVISLTSNTHFPQENLQKMRENAQIDLETHLDMQVGAFINNRCGADLEAVKQRHFDNGALSAKLFESHPELADRVVKQESNSNSCFVAFKNDSQLFDLEVYDKLSLFFLKRSSFGHTYSTLAPVQELLRLSAGATDPLDTYLQVESFMTSYKCDKNILLITIKNILQEYGDKMLPQSHEILLAVYLQALLKTTDVSNSFAELFLAHTAIRFLIAKSDCLKGREVIQSLGDKVSELQNALFNAHLNEPKHVALLHIGTQYFTSKVNQIETTLTVLSALDILKRIDFPDELISKLQLVENGKGTPPFYTVILALDLIPTNDNMIQEFCRCYCVNSDITLVIQSLADVGFFNDTTVRKVLAAYNKYPEMDGEVLANLIHVIHSAESTKTIFSGMPPEKLLQMSKVAKTLGDDLSVLAGKDTRYLAERLQSLAKYLTTQTLLSGIRAEETIPRPRPSRSG